MTIELGDKVKDTVSGFTGIAVGRAKWLYGCDRIVVQPPIDKDGKHVENNTFDELQLVVVKKGVVKSSESQPKKKVVTGGPRDDRAALKRN